MIDKYKSATPIDRRRFFKSFLGEFVSFLDAMKGRPQLLLADLFEMSDERISGVMPSIIPSCKIDVGERSVYALLSENKIKLYDRTETMDFIFNNFDGRTTLGKTAETASSRFGIESKVAFGEVRSFFLRLVDLHVLAPSNPTKLEGDIDDE